MEDKYQKEDEIDLIALVEKVWAGRRTIIKCLIIFGIIGLFIAIFSPKQYTATTIMVPTLSEKGKAGGLGGLAAMAGISLSGGSSEVIPPTLYPQIVQSIPFKKELTTTPLTVSDSEVPVSFSKYFQEIYTPGLLVGLKKYTIGLPGLLLGAIRGNGLEERNDVSYGEGIVFVSGEEEKLYKLLEDIVSLEVNDKDGYVKLSATMPEAVAAAQLTERAAQILQKRIIDFKSRKAKEQLKFIEERFIEKEKEFRKAEYTLARFQDRNKNVISAQAATTEKHFQAEYDLIYGVYSELAKQIEKQKIQVKEDTPVFTVIEPVSVPTVKSKPKRALILIIWLFLGGVVGVGVVLGQEFLKNLKRNHE